MKKVYETQSKKLSKPKKNRASFYIGFAKGLFSSAKEVDDFILRERKLWK